MSFRLYPLLIKLIIDDQKGFIKGKNISENIKLMFDIIDYGNIKDISEAVLSDNLRKAFDSLR